MVLNDYTIDVVIPAYNAEAFIIDAIKSVEAQTYKPGRIIVINDGSTDDTETTVKKYNSSIPLTYIIQTNAGPNAARNTGLKETTAPFVAFLDADDVWLPHKLESQIVLYKNDTTGNLGLVYGDYKNIDTNGVDRPDIPTVPPDPTMRGDIFTKLLDRNMILGSASNVLIRRSVFDEVGIFDTTLRVGEDWDMWLRISEKFGIDYVDQVLVAVRRHSQNQTNNILHLIKQDCAFIEKWLPRIDGKYPIPRMWGDRIVFNILRRLPHTDGFYTAKNSLSISIRRKLFAHTNGSIILACMSSLIKVLTTRDLRKRAFAALKRYG